MPFGFVFVRVRCLINLPALIYTLIKAALIKAALCSMRCVFTHPGVNFLWAVGADLGSLIRSSTQMEHPKSNSSAVFWP